MQDALQTEMLHHVGEFENAAELDYAACNVRGHIQNRLQSGVKIVRALVAEHVWTRRTPNRRQDTTKKASC